MAVRCRHIVQPPSEWDRQTDRRITVLFITGMSWGQLTACVCVVVADSVHAYATSGRRRRRQQPSKDAPHDGEQQQQQQHHNDDIVDISYVGASIPSRTFRILQQAVGGVTAPQGIVGAAPHTTRPAYVSSRRPSVDALVVMRQRCNRI